MSVKLVIAGGRNYPRFGDAEIDWLDALHVELDVLEVVSGAARGADLWGEAWAKSRSIPVKRFPAQWANFGGAAGPIRNKQMAKYADVVVLFPGGRGSDSMRNEARKASKPVFEFSPPELEK